MDGGEVVKVYLRNIDLSLAVLGTSDKPLDCMELFFLSVRCLLFNGINSSRNGKTSGKQVIEGVFSTGFSWDLVNLWNVWLFESGEEILHSIEVIEG